ncbi:MAG: ThuA domain-containing protein [Jejuia sp.]
MRLIILTGSNNHDWKGTTQQLQKMYLETGQFEVDVTESPDTLGYEDFEKYDAVLSNWNPFPENKKDWPKLTKEGLMKYVAEGGGFVLFHASSATFYDWPEFHELIGGTWGKKTRHGKITEHKIVFTDKTHPITKGIEDFWITDELWVNLEIQENPNILATSFSNSENKGRDKMEPVMLWNTKGKGRCFYNVLGHHVVALKNESWKKIMLRGTEWTATGKVSKLE